MAQRQDRQRQLLYVSDSVGSSVLGDGLVPRRPWGPAMTQMEVEAVVMVVEEVMEVMVVEVMVVKNERQPNSELQAFASTCSK